MTAISHFYGVRGESLARTKLLSKGYTLLESNFRCPWGEIDLIVQDALTIVFVEVKTRRSVVCGFPLESVTLQKQKKLIRTAEYYLSLHAQMDRAWRIDVISVLLSSSGTLQSMRIIQNAVMDS